MATHLAPGSATITRGHHPHVSTPTLNLHRDVEFVRAGYSVVPIAPMVMQRQNGVRSRWRGGAGLLEELRRECLGRVHGISVDRADVDQLLG